MFVPNLDVDAYVASLVLIGGYHLYLRLRLRRDLTYTIQSINNTARTAWVENIMADKSNGLLAVQTLRNSTMAATFLASTAILMSMGVLNLMQSSADKESVLHSLQSSLVSGGDFANLKLLLLLVTFFGAFFCFSMAVRMYNHVGYLINSSNSKYQFSPSTRYVSELLNRSGDYYTYGMRAYYISVPMIFSLYNPYYMVAASVGLIVWLYNVDRTPKVQITTDDAQLMKHGKGTDSLTPLRARAGSSSLRKQDDGDTDVPDFNVVASGNMGGSS